MTFSIIPLSFAPIYVCENAFSLYHDELNYIKGLAEHQSDGGNYLSDGSYILEDQSMSRVKGLLETHLQTYIDQVLEIKDKFKITNSWTTRNPKNSTHHPHSHPNSIISGVYYVNCSSGDFFLNTTPLFSKEFNFNYTYENFNFVNSKSWRIPAKTGMILIFPSWMQHEVTANKSDSDRRIIGFNSFLDLQHSSLGKEDNYTRLVF